MRTVSTDHDAQAYVLDTLSGHNILAVPRALLLELHDAAGSWEAIPAMEHDRYWEIIRRWDLRDRPVVIL